MGVMRKVLICILLCLTILLTSCEGNFSEADISMYGINLTHVQAYSSSAYYLSKEGKLYSPGADSDASSFVVYQDSKKGIVAENVKYFDEFIGGGLYIDNNDNLYIWNKTELPAYGYNKAKTHTKILEGVRFATSNSYGIIYIDINSDLYLIGSFSGKSYSVDTPKLLAKNVVCADINDKTIIWGQSNGSIDCYGETDSDMMLSLNTQFKNSTISDIQLTKGYVAVVSNGELWFHGDYEQLIFGKTSENKHLLKLGDNIAKISCSFRTVMALDGDGNALLWGRCASNDKKNTQEPQFEYYNAFLLTENATDIFVSDSCICYIDKKGCSNIYYSGGWPSFYGNSVDDKFVGIKREPSTWIK